MTRPKFKFGDRVRVKELAQKMPIFYHGEYGNVTEVIFQEGSSVISVKLDNIAQEILIYVVDLELVSLSTYGHHSGFWARVNGMLRTERELDE